MDNSPEEPSWLDRRLFGVSRRVAIWGAFSVALVFFARAGLGSAGGSAACLVVCGGSLVLLGRLGRDGWLLIVAGAALIVAGAVALIVAGAWILGATGAGGGGL